MNIINIINIYKKLSKCFLFKNKYFYYLKVFNINIFTLFKLYSNFYNLN